MEPHFMVIKETVIVDVDVDVVEKKNYRGQGECTHNSYKRNTIYHKKWNHTEAKQNENKGLQNKLTKNYEDKCYRCGMKGNWSRTCRTPKLLVDLYQASIKEKEK